MKSTGSILQCGQSEGVPGATAAVSNSMCPSQCWQVHLTFIFFLWLASGATIHPPGRDVQRLVSRQIPAGRRTEFFKGMGVVRRRPGGGSAAALPKEMKRFVRSEEQTAEL